MKFGGFILTAVLILPKDPLKGSIIKTVVVNAQVESQAHAYKSAEEVRTELTIVYDIFMRYIVTNAEAYPEKYYLGKLLKDLNTLRDSKR